MTCTELQQLLNAYADTELSLETSIEIQKHLASCDPCSRELQNILVLRNALKSHELYFTPAATLQSRIFANIETNSPVTAGRRATLFTGWSIAASFAAAACLIFIGLALWHSGLGTTKVGSRDIAEEIFSSDVRSLMSNNHGMDVISTDQHTVKPWFAGKLDFPPTVQDFAKQGYPLVGGRRDYIAGHVVAVLIYKRHKHWIDLYMWPSSIDSSTQVQTVHGYHLLQWTQNGMADWAISDVNTADLSAFANLFK